MLQAAETFGTVGWITGTMFALAAGATLGPALVRWVRCRRG